MEPIEGYRLGAYLGGGGFGEVWEAEKNDGSVVALKFLPCGNDIKARLEIQAIQTVRQLRHPNLIQIDQVWAYDGYLVLSMERADGSLFDLFEVYQSELSTPIEREHLLMLFNQAAAGLDFLNAKQHLINGYLIALQHCDVNPANMLVFGDTLKLTDFSLTSVLGASQRPHRRAGTTDFASPEIFRGQLSDRTDQYALAISYCLLRGGRLPFADSPRTFGRAYVRPGPDLTMLPESERPVVSRALAPLPMDRYRWCGDFIGELEKIALNEEENATQKANSTQIRPVSRNDRRDWLRHPCSLNAVWSPLDGHHEGPGVGQVQNLSVTGMGMLVTSRVKLGSILTLKLEDERSYVSRPLLAKVVHTEQKDSGHWCIGCAFVNRLSSAELQALL